jgi:hypothetical protein
MTNWDDIRTHEDDGMCAVLILDSCDWSMVEPAGSWHQCGVHAAWTQW